MKKSSDKMREREEGGMTICGKKQVRRRRKPYQEKLLNMAEARREIVTALKLHRAAVKHKTCPPVSQRNDDFVLPDHALGLNLNLEDFIITTTTTTSTSTPSSSTPPPVPDQFKFVKSEELVTSPFYQVMEFPSWLNANDANYLQHHDFSNFQDPTLPCMDIEEIEGMDADWLA